MVGISAVAYLAVPSAWADLPTPPPKPERWEFLGTYEVGDGAGRGPVNVVIDPDSISRYGDIVHAFIGRDCDQLNGRWAHCVFVVSYKIDCKFHTYNELWFKTDRGVQNTEDQWVTIEPDSDVALAEKKVCTVPAPQKPPGAAALDRAP
jgi:hypothetical protein